MGNLLIAGALVIVCLLDVIITIIITLVVESKRIKNDTTEKRVF